MVVVNKDLSTGLTCPTADRITSVYEAPSTRQESIHNANRRPKMTKSRSTSSLSVPGGARSRSL
eukprot:Pgem_evm1s7506